jgi:uncharacterized protein YbcI
MAEQRERQVQEAIADELLRIHEESYGKSAGRVQVLLSDDAVVVFMDDLELQRSEEFLVESGDPDSVIEVRGRYQRAIEATFSAAVERATGRRVNSFSSVTKLDPNYIVEIFRLEPLGDGEGDGGGGG